MGQSYPGTTRVPSDVGRHHVAAGSSRRTEVISDHSHSKSAE